MSVLFKQVLSQILSCSSKYCRCPVQADIVMSHCPFKQVLSCSSRYCRCPVQADIVMSHCPFKQVLQVLFCPRCFPIQADIVLFKQILSGFPFQAEILSRLPPFRASPQDFKTHFVGVCILRTSISFQFINKKFFFLPKKKKKKKEFFCRLEGDMFFLLLRPYRKHYYSARTTGSKSIATLISRAQNINKKYDNLHFLTFDF